MTFETPKPGLPSPHIMVRRIQGEDLAGAASLHRQVFADYFLAHLGQGFLQRFYGEFVERPGNYGSVAIHGDRPIGVVVGTVDADAFYSQFYSCNLVATILVFLKRFAADPYIRRNCMARMPHVRRALRSVARHLRGSTPVGTPSTLPLPARLLSIAVDPDFRGQDLAEELVDHFCQQLMQNGVGAVGLSVRADNGRAIAFYERTGWQRTEATDTTIQYSRSTQPHHSAESK